MKLFNVLVAILVMAGLSACSSTSEDTGYTYVDDGEVISEPLITEEMSMDGTVIEAVSRPDIDAGTMMDAKLRETQVFYFDFDRSEIQDQYLQTLSAHSSFLSMNPDLNVIIHGHADERGTREYNMALAERRGLSITEMLMRYGVSNAQIQTVSHGEEKPAVIGHDEQAWALNRRVEIEYRK